MESAADFKRRLIRQGGLSSSIVEAAWPDWWSDEAESSDSAKAELRFSIARKLGLDPRTLLADDVPGWIWEDAARFKSFRGDIHGHQPAISSFGMALGRILLNASVPSLVPASGVPSTAAALRAMLLQSAPTVGLLELLQLSWILGIPVIHLRAYPLSAKRMSAMSVCIEDRYVIFLAKDGEYPAASAFHLAHELGHIFLGHLTAGQSIVDLGGWDEPEDESDEEELAADAFALELLMGDPHPRFEIQGQGRNARELAAEARRVEAEYRIEAGMLALAYGHFTQNWETATASLRHIYPEAHPVWDAVNRIAQQNIAWAEIDDESESYLRAVMGGISG